MANRKTIKARVKSYKSFWFYMLILSKKLKAKWLFKAIHRKPMMFTYISVNGRDWQKQTHFLTKDGFVAASDYFKAVK